MKRKFAVLLSLAVMASAVFSPAAVMADSGKTYVALGADLSGDNRSTVLKLLDVTEEELKNDTLLTVTNAEEHQYLDSYLDSSVIGTYALSSCKVQETTSGGITVETHNITYCTASMYENALATAGVQNAQIVVAAPMAISGTSALVGVLKAYEAMTGSTISPELVDAAADELTTTTQIAESTGDSDRIAQLIAAIKQIILSHNYETDEDIDAAIREVAAQMDITLSDSDVATIRNLCKKLDGLNIDSSSLQQQASSVYEQIKNGNYDLSQFGITNEDTNGILQVLSNIWTQIVSFFTGFFN